MPITGFLEAFSSILIEFALKQTGWVDSLCPPWFTLKRKVYYKKVGPHKMKKVLFLIISIAVILVSVMLDFPTRANLDKLERAYIKTWVEVFTQYDRPEKFSEIDKSLRPDLIVYRKFSDDSWIAAVCAPLVEWSYSATVAIDSNGEIKSSRKDLSGYEALYSMIHNNQAENIQELYELTSDFHWVKEVPSNSHSGRMPDGAA